MVYSSFVARLTPVLRILSATAISFILALLPGDTIPSPKGAYFDSLMEVREPIPVARELLIVEPAASSRSANGEDTSPAEAVWAVAELGAERVLLPPSWLERDGSGLSTSERVSRLTTRLEEEFDLIDENVAELFEAIRIGSIEPEEADRFVAELRRLIANSRYRIQEELRSSSDASIASVAEMIEVFGNGRLGTELSELELSLPDYPSAMPIPVAPEDDRGDLALRRLPYSSLSRYLSLARQLSTQLSGLEEAGVFDQTDPQKRPSIMADHVRTVRKELYAAPSESRAEAWRDAVKEYFETIAELIDEETEARLLDRLGILEEENPTDESAANIREMREELENTFANLRSEYATVVALRGELAETIEGSLVIFGDGETRRYASARHTAWPFQIEPTEAEGRAVMANSVLVEEYLLAPDGWHRISLLTAAGLLIAVILSLVSPARAVALSPAVLILVAGIFPGLFLMADVWIDPTAIATVLAGATVASLLAALISQWCVERAVTGRAAYRLPPRLLRQSFHRGTLPESAGRRRRSIVVVVAPENEPDEATFSVHREGSIALASFHKEISRRIRKLGGVVLGEEGTTVLSVFAAPGTTGETGESQGDVPNVRLARDACEAAKALLSASLPGGVAVRCGVDVGGLTFYTSPIGGYRAAGPAITYARRLCGLAHKHRRAALFGAGVAAACGAEQESARFREEGKLVLPGGKERYAFFSLTEIDPPSP